MNIRGDNISPFYCLNYIIINILVNKMINSNARIVRGNDFKLHLILEAPTMEDQQIVWDDFDLTSCSEINCSLICEKDSVSIPVPFELVDGTTNELICDIKGSYLHIGGYGVEVKGIDRNGNAWRWKAKGREMFSIVDNTSTANINPDIETVDISARVGFIIPQGPKGDTGDQGIQGPQGPKGDTGDKGSMWYYTPESPGAEAATLLVRDLQGNSVKDIPLYSTVLALDCGDIYQWQGEYSGDLRVWRRIGNIMGPTGDKGDTGDQGATGDKGSTGDKGDTGDQGLQGPTGDKGATGDKGSTGDKGATGDKGSTGDKGATGDRGPSNQADWGSTDSASPDFIKNKPTNIVTANQSLSVAVVSSMPASPDNNTLYLVTS